MKLTCGITAAEEKAKVEKEDKVNTVLFFFSFLFKIKKKIVLGFFFPSKFSNVRRGRVSFVNGSTLRSGWEVSDSEALLNMVLERGWSERDRNKCRWRKKKKSEMKKNVKIKRCKSQELTMYLI